VVDQIDDLPAGLIPSILGQGVCVDPGVACQEREVTRRLESQRDGLVRITVTSFMPFSEGFG